MNALAQTSMSGVMRSTHKNADSLSQNSKSMSKFSDNNSDAGYNEKKFVKHGGSDLKVGESKNHSFASDMEDSVHAAMITNGLNQLPPIFMPNKKNKKKSIAPTKKPLPQIQKIATHKKTYVSPYSMKAI